MKTAFHLKLGCVVVAFCSASSAAFATTYNWVSWTFPSSQTASANAPGYGSVGVSVQGASTTAIPFTIQFDNVPFTPASAESVGAGSSSGANQLWTTLVDFTSISSTSGLILGLGNFGHGTTNFPGYRLTALDSLGAPMSLAGFTEIGSYDHTWVLIDGNPAFVQFNDDVSLNSATGDFNVIATPGLNENNSDILLLSLPAGVGQLSIVPIAPSGGDTLNVLVAAVPEPGSLALVLLGVGALTLRGWKRLNARGEGSQKAE